MGRKKDLLGNRYGRLKVVKEGKRDKFGHIFWGCVCDCGNELSVVGYSLESGNTKSCGCLNIERITKHEMHDSPEYSSWESMIQRCTNPNASGYDHYGGRGITVCHRWRKFENFYKDMGPKPNKNASIERKDNNEGYHPENCFWASKTRQSRNTRRPSHNTTGVKGVCIDSRNGKYRAVISVKRKQIHLGTFATIKEAAEARRAGELKYWGRTL